MEQKESDIANLQSDQTASNPNTINDVDHRYCATGTSEAMALADIQKAKLAMDKAKVSTRGRRGVFDPFVTYQLQQISNVIQQDVYGANAHIKEGMNGGSYIGRFAGFEMYESLLLDNSIAETIVATGVGSGSVSVTDGFANMLVGEDAFVGAMRAMPDLRGWRDDNTRSDVYHVTTRYGIKLFRPESLVVILTDPA